MPSLTIRHVTTYRYRKPVAFGEHRMMLRPRDFHDQRVIDAQLDITPTPESLRFVQDAHGNHVTIARFATRAQELRVESTVCVEHAPAPVLDLDLDEAASPLPAYRDDELPDLVGYMERQEADPADAVGSWARGFLADGASVGTFELLARLSQAIHRSFRYRRREEKGIRPALETLQRREGSCRDFAVLLIEAARALGLAARFVSGYLAVPYEETEAPTSDSPKGATHAWAQVYVPGAGWIDFDPTSGSIGRTGLVTVAHVRDPRHAICLHGTFYGAAGDHIGMDVRVSVTRGAREPAGPELAQARRLIA